MSLLRFVFVLASLSLVLLAPGAPSLAGGDTFVVNLTSDSADFSPADGRCDIDSNAGNGDNCTLRAAIAQANSSVELDIVEFDIPSAAPHVITPMTPLPTVTQSLSIDGTTQPDCVNYPCIELDGTSAGGIADGLTVSANDVTVRGLVIRGFGGSGMAVVTGADNTTIVGNYIGTTASGMAADGNEIGILTYGMNGTIGGADEADRNVLSGNDVGLIINGPATSTGNHVIGNYIGVGPDGETAVANNNQGITAALPVLGDIAQNTIGPGNVISGNATGGLFLMGSGFTVVGNRIGTDAGGQNAVSNGGTGLVVSGGFTTVGGTTPAERNVISGNDGPGIWVIVNIGEVRDNVIAGNYIGTNAAGNAALPNTEEGVVLDFDVFNTTIGGEEPGARNLISGNGGYGIRIEDAPNNQVIGNYVGASVNGEGAMGNGLEGIRIIDDKSTGNIIDGNLVVDNGQSGVSIFSLATDNRVIRNRIGLTPSGAPLGNGDDGVHILGASGNEVGGAEDEANIIAHNAGDGVYVSSVENFADRNTIRRNSIHTNTGLGINNEPGANENIAPPSLMAGALSVTGTACVDCIIDFFSDDVDEGRTYEGTVVADGAGNFEFSEPMTGPFTTATATNATGSTSEFSAPVETPEQPTPTPTPEPTATPTPTDTPEPTETPVATATATPTPTPAASETPSASKTPSPEGIQGDTDCDKDADSVDALFVLREVAGFAPSRCIDTGDVDCDGDRDSVDALGILRHVAALPPLVQQEPCADIGTPV